jgi:hypothetical protein
MKDIVDTPASGGWPTIAGIAADLPAIYDLCETMGEGAAHENQWLAAHANVPDKLATRVPIRFEVLKDRAHAHAKALESLAFLLEPQSADEALSLLLLADSAFQEFVADAYNAQNGELAACQDAAWDNVTRALAAIVRWLHNNGAVSPLLKDHFSKANLLPPEEEAAAALMKAKELEAWRKAQPAP